MQYRGLTWDHPRGYRALRSAAEKLSESRDGLSLTWDTHPLEGFEAHPIADLCERYDLVVLDHPHVGEAVAGNCLQPLESLFSAVEIANFKTDTIGPCLSSYRFEQRHWALPLDAATQVMAYRADLLERPPPQTWEQLISLSDKDVPITLSLAGPHAALSFQSIVASLRTNAVEPERERFVEPELGQQALEIMTRLAARSPAALAAANPIKILDYMARRSDVVLCPLVYGYVNYAHAIAFANAPRAAKFAPGSNGTNVNSASDRVANQQGRPGSTLGGTGIGISTRCQVTQPLLNHLRWLMSADAQTNFIPCHDGQPSRRTAWQDDAVNKQWNNFYRNTAETLEHAYVRPRHNHAIAFQTKASALLRDAVANNRAPQAVINEIETLYQESLP